MTDHREKSQWTKERKIKYLKKKIFNLERDILYLQSKLNGYFCELKEVTSNDIP